MEAWKAREESIMPQYKNCMRQIKDRKENGCAYYLRFGSLYSEVINMLLDKGYDITERKKEVEEIIISWEFAKEGRRGEHKVLDLSERPNFSAVVLQHSPKVAVEE